MSADIALPLANIDRRVESCLCRVGHLQDCNIISDIICFNSSIKNENKIGLAIQYGFRPHEL